MIRKSVTLEKGISVYAGPWMAERDGARPKAVTLTEDQTFEAIFILRVPRVEDQNGTFVVRVGFDGYHPADLERAIPELGFEYTVPASAIPTGDTNLAALLTGAILPSVLGAALGTGEPLEGGTLMAAG